jgi:thioredoxin 1
MKGKVTIAKINIDENPQTPMKYGVRGIPTLILFKNGQVAATKIGAEPKQKLVSWINTAIAQDGTFSRCGLTPTPQGRANRK